jgi:hypothetical protein
MSTPEQQGLSRPGRLVTVWTTEHRGEKFRYIATSDGRLVSFGQ